MQYFGLRFVNFEHFLFQHLVTLQSHSNFSASFSLSHPVWPNLAKFWRFISYLAKCGTYFCDITGLIFIVANGQILKHNLTIWSHCSHLWKAWRNLFQHISSSLIFTQTIHSIFPSNKIEENLSFAFEREKCVFMFIAQNNKLEQD